jgi:hypothetical protein
MNKDFILFNLREARDQILQVIQDIEPDPEYEYGGYWADMTHLCHPINTAWNARGASDTQARECSEENYIKWQQFPVGDEICLGP